jgi:glycerol uptake facilitator-like aquaporin
MTLLYKCIIEFIGTFIFLYVIIATGNPYAIGLILTCMILIGGNISGGNYNPAVSVMMVLANKLNANEMIPYIFSQLMGAVCAFYLYKITK